MRKSLSLAVSTLQALMLIQSKIRKTRGRLELQKSNIFLIGGHWLRKNSAARLGGYVNGRLVADATTLTESGYVGKVEIFFAAAASGRYGVEEAQREIIYMRN